MARWVTLGQILDPTDRAGWMQTHAALPFAASVEGDLVRVLCGGRDAEGRAQTGVVDMTIGGGGPRLVNVAQEPIISVGPLGAFDDRGALPSCSVFREGVWHLYYTGVMLGQTVPFYYFVGLAQANDLDTAAVKISAAPLLPFNRVDPFLTASPYVMIDEGRWRMWYMSGVRWEIVDGKPKHFYHLRYAESKDGIEWDRTGRVAIDFSEGEYAMSRPSVLRDDDGYHMWFAARGDVYRIHYAYSPDGYEWTRKGAAGIEGSPGGWDAEMQCYPNVFEHRGRRYMLYNGNGYGKSGFGLAVLCEE